METLGIQVAKEPVKPYPLLIGRLGQDPGKKTVLIYAHYDVKSFCSFNNVLKRRLEFAGNKINCPVLSGNRKALACQPTFCL